MTTIIYREQEGTGLGEYARVLMKGLTQIGYKFNPLPIVENSKFKRIKSYLAPKAHYTEPFSLVLGADLVTAHDLRFLDDSIHTNNYRLALSYSLKTARHLVVSSNTIASEFINWYPPLKDRIIIAHWGVDTDLYTLRDDDVKTYDSMDHDRIRVLMVGRIARHKNFHAALSQLVNNPRFEVTLVSNPVGTLSDEQYQREMNDIISRADNVILMHDLSYLQLKQVYALSDVYLHPSLDGGFEMPIYEALSMGTDAIVRSIELHKELLGDTVYYSNFDNDLAQEIIDIVDFKKKPHLHDFVESNYSPRTMAKEMVRAYNEAGVA